MGKIAKIIITAGLVIAAAVGFMTFKGMHRTADNQIEATSKIMFDVYLRSLTYTGNDVPVKAGEKTFISIRNVPYTDLDIIDVKTERKKIVLPVLNKPVVVEDASQSNLYDMVITLTDNAKITKDGAVVGGNKIKIGLPITLEGKDYKFTGTVSDLTVMQVEDEELRKSINTTNDIQ
ncbi:MAG: DUF4330 domain-containing protein [Heliobacteriaceae bacterium]|jgi:hypothetical protein|nr:DUF4330 domain-containing protein [Heliobacteriaceae bacterium]